MWLHVDAAYAGSALICPEHQHILKGIESANSFNMNPNKWMLVNFDCSAMWVRDRKILMNALTVDPLYLQHAQSDRAIDFRHWGIPLSRRFRSLKIWFVIRTYGVEGLQKYIRDHCRLARKFEQFVAEDERFQVLGKVSLGLVCFRLKGHNYRTQMLLRAINMSGKLHMVPALINEDYVIRFAICAQHAVDDDVTFAWNVISEMATDVLAVCDSSKETETLKEFHRIESLEIESEDSLSSSDRDLPPYESPPPIPEDDEVFPFDDNIPSIPSIPTLCQSARTPANGPLPAYRRRNMLLRMISDPKCYNPRVLKSLCHEKRHRSETAKQFFRAGAHYRANQLPTVDCVSQSESTTTNSSSCSSCAAAAATRALNGSQQD
jgi:aromatic-L-amino-acid decarboxylase